MNQLIFISIGLVIIFFSSVLGSSFVLFKKRSTDKNNYFLSFAGGMMLSAAIFSLIYPSFDYSKNIGLNELIPCIGGIILGSLFILLFDIVVFKQNKTGKKAKKLFLGMSLHNFPEGLVVGLTFGLVLNQKENSSYWFAIMFALGIGIQNIPESAALAFPLAEEYNSKKKGFVLGVLSGFIEPVAAVIGIFISKIATNIMPWVLCFGAGSIIYVVIDELVLEGNSEKEKKKLNIAFMLGFLIMLLIDIVFN